jgi:hypothetical protein
MTACTSTLTNPYAGYRYGTGTCRSLQSGGNLDLGGKTNFFRAQAMLKLQKKLHHHIDSEF